MASRIAPTRGSSSRINSSRISSLKAACSESHKLRSVAKTLKSIGAVSNVSGVRFKTCLEALSLISLRPELDIGNLKCCGQFREHYPCQNPAIRDAPKSRLS